MTNVARAAGTRLLVVAAFAAVPLLSACLGSSDSPEPVPTALVFAVQPADATPYGTDTGTLAPAVKVALVDQFGSVYRAGSVPVTLAIGAQPNAGIYQGVLFGTTTVATVDGVATYTNLAVTQIGNGYTLTASAPGVAPVSSVAFAIKPSTAGFKATGEAGYEILWLVSMGINFQGPIDAYVDDEPNPINSSAFASYSVPGWGTNSPRLPVFEYQHALGSPFAPPGPLVPYTDPYGYTWGFIARVQNYNWPFDPTDYPTMSPPPKSGWQVGNTTTAVPPGVVKYTYNNKNQVLLFRARDAAGKPIERYFVTDQFGNTFLMKSANSANDTTARLSAAFDAAVLPKGWVKTRANLTQDLFVPPIYGANYAAVFQEFRDSADSAYTQVLWGPGGDSIAQQIGAPMPLWLGDLGGRLNGTPHDDAMYGGRGDDRFYPDAGDDTIDGGGGINGTFVAGRCAEYTVARADGKVIVRGPDGTKTLVNVQYLQCSDARLPL